jgi:hypothetical protein
MGCNIWSSSALESKRTSDAGGGTAGWLVTWMTVQPHAAIVLRRISIRFICNSRLRQPGEQFLRRRHLPGIATATANNSNGWTLAIGKSFIKQYKQEGSSTSSPTGS